MPQEKVKIAKRILLTILTLTVTGFLFRGWLYRHFVTYTSIGIKTNYLVTDEKLATYIESDIDSQGEPDISQIIKLALSKTSKQLNFTANKNDTDPNKLIYSQTAHCVGYASFFAATCNYLIKKYHLADTWTAKPQVGQIYLFGTNIHHYTNSSFFKDHDFVIIENKATGQILAVDPTVNDYFHIDFVTCVQ